MVQLSRETLQGLLYYYETSADLDEGIRIQTVDAFKWMIAKMDEEAAILAKKRKSPNKTGCVQVDPETNKEIARYATQKEALEAIGKDPKKSGISDAINGRTSTHMAYQYKWYFADEWDSMKH